LEPSRTNRPPLRARSRYHRAVTTLHRPKGS
jgi:hypothetical protein